MASTNECLWPESCGTFDPKQKSIQNFSTSDSVICISAALSVFRSTHFHGKREPIRGMNRGRYFQQLTGSIEVPACDLESR